MLTILALSVHLVTAAWEPSCCKPEQVAEVRQEYQKQVLDHLPQSAKPASELERSCFWAGWLMMSMPYSAKNLMKTMGAAWFGSGEQKLARDVWFEAKKFYEQNCKGPGPGSPSARWEKALQHAAAATGGHGMARETLDADAQWSRLQEAERALNATIGEINMAALRAAPMAPDLGGVAVAFTVHNTPAEAAARVPIIAAASLPADLLWAGLMALLRSPDAYRAAVQAAR